MVALNCGENQFPDPALAERAAGVLAVALGSEPAAADEPSRTAGVCQLCAKLELEIAELESETERQVFLEDLGVEEPAIHVLTRLLYQALGYISFFTTGEDEVRAWSIRAGGTAVDAAYAIHSDLARGFIRAEVMAYSDLVAAGGQRAQGRSGTQGKRETSRERQGLHRRRR